MIEKIVKSLDKNKKNYAVFDCDGTLIADDVETQMMKYQINNKEYRVTLEEIYQKFKELGIDAKDLEDNDKFYDYYEEAYTTKNYSMASFLLKDYSYLEVEEMVDKLYDKLKIREEMKNLVKYLQDNGVEVFICSASQQKEVEAVAKYFNIKKENVIAVVEENGNEVGIVPRQMGKVEAITKRIGQDPFLVAGDADGDYYMLTRFNILHGMIINPKKNTKVESLVDNNTFFKYII